MRAAAVTLIIAGWTAAVSTQPTFSSRVEGVRVDVLVTDSSRKPLRGLSPSDFIIRDNGEGFQLREGGDGMGLQNMKYRANLIGGALKITSAPGDGTVVKCTLPLRRDKAA